MCYIRSDIPAYQINPDCGPLEALQVNCILDRQKWSILGLYRKPSLPQRLINEHLDTVLDTNVNLCDKYMLIGDLNCDMLQMRGNENAVSKLCCDFNLVNVIKDPTCFKGENPTLLDVILVSDKSICKSGSVTPCPLSDFHYFVHGVFKTQMPRTTTRKILYRSFKHFNPEDFGSDLRKAPFHVGEVLDIHSHMEYFQDLFLNILDQHTPIKSKVIRTSQCPHMTKKWKSTMYKRNMTKFFLSKRLFSHHFSHGKEPILVLFARKINQFGCFCSQNQPIWLFLLAKSTIVAHFPWQYNHLSPFPMQEWPNRLISLP